MEKTIVNSILIKSSKENVWDALVNPSKTKIYMFGCETISDWKIGRDLFYTAKVKPKQYCGKEVMKDKKWFLLKVKFSCLSPIKN